MDRSTFLQLADEAIRRVEDWLEEFDPDEVDFSAADGVLKIHFAGGPTFVVNRQTAANQMWYAAGVRAWHYDYAGRPVRDIETIPSCGPRSVPPHPREAPDGAQEDRRRTPHDRPMA